MVESASAIVGLGFFGGFVKHCFEATYGHTIGGEAHHAYRHLVERLKERLHDGELPPTTISAWPSKTPCSKPPAPSR